MRDMFSKIFQFILFTGKSAATRGCCCTGGTCAAAGAPGRTADLPSMFPDSYCFRACYPQHKYSYRNLVRLLFKTGGHKFGLVPLCVYTRTIVLASRLATKAVRHTGPRLHSQLPLTDVSGDKCLLNGDHPAARRLCRGASGSAGFDSAGGITTVTQFSRLNSQSEKQKHLSALVSEGNATKEDHPAAPLLKGHLLTK